MRVSFPKRFSCSSSGCTLSNWEHRLELHTKAMYKSEGIFGKRIQLDLALTNMNWQQPFGINGLTVNTASISFLMVWGAAQVTRNGPSVQMTCHFTLDASNKALMTNEQAKRKARKAGLLLLEDAELRERENALKNSTPWELKYDLVLMQRLLGVPDTSPHVDERHPSIELITGSFGSNPSYQVQGTVGCLPCLVVTCYLLMCLLHHNTPTPHSCLAEMHE